MIVNGKTQSEINQVKREIQVNKDKLYDTHSEADRVGNRLYLYLCTDYLKSTRELEDKIARQEKEVREWYRSNPHYRGLWTQNEEAKKKLNKHSTQPISRLK